MSPDVPKRASAPSVQPRRDDHAAAYARVRRVVDLVRNTPIREDSMTLLSSEQTVQSAGEAALQLVIEAFATRQQGRLVKVVFEATKS